MAITTAVVPVAGLATRLRPLSRGVPKGLLPVAGQPVIQRVVDELAACGIERVVLVTGRGRAAFAAHFAESDGPEMVCVRPARSAGPRRRDPARRAAARRPVRDRPGRRAAGPRRPAPTVLRLAAAVEAGASAAVAVERSGRKRPAATGSSCPPAMASPLPIAGVVEKPAPGAAPSRLAIAGRYAATPALLDALRDNRPPDGEWSSPTP